MQGSGLSARDPWLFESKIRFSSDADIVRLTNARIIIIIIINRLRHSVEDYYCAKFQVIPIRGFRFILLTYTPTHTYTHRDKVIAISAPPYYVVGADNQVSVISITIPFGKWKKRSERRKHCARAGCSKVRTPPARCQKSTDRTNYNTLRRS